MPLDLRQDHLADLGQDQLIRPATFANKMQQRLVLRAYPRRRSQRCHRLHALALPGHHQPNAIIT
jgi:hypothetical protein